jgi:hypothetical protein
MELVSSKTFSTSDWDPWTGDRPIAKPLHTQDTIQKKKERGHTSMPVVGFEPTIIGHESLSSNSKLADVCY